MGYKAIQYSDETWDEYFRYIPKAPSRIRLINWLIKNFPRRLFKFLNPSVREKFIFHILLFRTNLGTYSSSGPHSEYRLVKADQETIFELASHDEGLPLSVFHNRIDAGDECYCLVYKGNIVSYNWVSFNTCTVFAGFDRFIPFMQLKSEEAFLYDFYTYINERERGFGKILKDCLMTYLKEQGVCYAYVAVPYENPVSIKIQLTLGGYLFAMFYNYRVMSWCFSLRGTDRELESAARWLRENVTL